MKTLHASVYSDTNISIIFLKLKFTNWIFKIWIYLFNFLKLKKIVYPSIFPALQYSLKRLHSAFTFLAPMLQQIIIKELDN